MAKPIGQLYKIKLESGRILGPIGLDRVRSLILKNRILGTEQARPYPDGEWQDINHIPEIAEIILDRLQGRSQDNSTARLGHGVMVHPIPDQGATHVLPANNPVAPPTSLPAEKPRPPAATRQAVEIHLEKIETSDPHVTRVAPVEDKTQLELEDDSVNYSYSGTRVEPSFENHPEPPPNEETLELFGLEETPEFGKPSVQPPQSLSQENTIVFQRSPSPLSLDGSSRGGGRYQKFKSIIVAVAVLMAAHEVFFDVPDQRPVVKAIPLKPRLPGSSKDGANPKKSEELYNKAMQYYVADHVVGYRKAAQLFLAAATADNENARALAMLASSYINLIDASNKDDTYFSVISSLLRSSRAKNVDLPETVIADVEFYIITNNAEAAQNRIVEYTRKHKSFGLEMFYYLAEAFYTRGDIANAARFINQFPENKIFSAKIFHLKGLIAERSSPEEALIEYKKAVKFNPNHARSRLKIASLMARNGRLRDTEPHLKFLVKSQHLLAPKQLAEVFFLNSQHNSLLGKYDYALGDIERSVKLDRENSDYLLELYSLRGRLGESSDTLKSQARMYYFLGEGEKLIREGKHQDALTQFLSARQANLKSSLPLIRAGDMFTHLNDIANARLNYEIAAKKAPKSIAIWSKYIDTLIQSYDWDEAQKAMDRFRNLPGNQSAIDKLAGDMYAKQGRYDIAHAHYRKAMGRASIDPKVYIAFAKNLMALDDYQNAPFFFALALRFDPLNTEALINTSHCIAKIESIDRAISMLQDELQKGSPDAARLLSTIGEFQIQKGEWDQAQLSVDQAVSLNPESAMPWKVQARIFLNQEGRDREALDKALAAFKSYSDRNASDPSGYLERYRVFIRKTQYERANEELGRIYAVYPKYPNLHYYKGALYAIMGNHKTAIDEFLLELKNNPGSVNTFLALGKEYLEVQMPKEALDQFNQAMQLAPQAADPKHLSGYANYLMKNYQGALALYRAALTYDHANPLIYKRMGMAFRDMGDLNGARDAFRKYIEMEPDALDKAEFEKFL